MDDLHSPDDLDTLFGRGLRETSAQTGRRVRRRLLDRWPATVFSVRSDRTQQTVTVRWSGGPTQAEVEEITSPHSGDMTRPTTLWSSPTGNVCLVESVTAIVLDRSWEQ